MARRFCSARKEWKCKVLVSVMDEYACEGASVTTDFVQRELAVCAGHPTWAARLWFEGLHLTLGFPPTNWIEESNC